MSVVMKMNATRRIQPEAYLKIRKACVKLHIHASPEVGMTYKLCMKNSHTFCYKKIYEYFRSEIKYIFVLILLQLNKYTNCKGIKNNTNFRQITRIQEKLDTTCK
jgi:hypothetical protein